MSTAWIEPIGKGLCLGKSKAALNRWILFICHILLIASTSCSLFPTQTTSLPSTTAFLSLASQTAVLTQFSNTISTDTASPSATLTPSFTPNVLPPATLAPPDTLTPTSTPSATTSPTYAVLHGKMLQRANCRYGPGAPYLYKYGLLPDTPMDVIGRNDAGTWLLIQVRGGDNPCWIKASLMEVQGDVLSAAPTYIPLPLSPYYGALTGVAAVRQGDEVTVSWHPLSLRAGDEVDLVVEAPYVIEAWVCQDGKLVFIPMGAYTNIATIRDEPGCSEPSHARLLAAEKHGYTPWVEIPWP